MPVDHFPSTHATWIDAQLTIAEDGDRAAARGDSAGQGRATNARDAIRRHVMERYAPALTAYVSTPELRRLGERDELVSGFFARTFEVDGSEIAESLQSAEPGPAAAFDRAWALALTNEAYRQVQADLVSRGRGVDDAVFRMHVVEGLTYAQVAARSGRTEAECLNTARRVSNALRAAVRDLLREEGVQESDMDAAVAEVLAIVERST
jgi:DNA-directed RNA polymerase specialized sigma24 family protein